MKGTNLQGMKGTNLKERKGTNLNFVFFFQSKWQTRQDKTVNQRKSEKRLEESNQ